MPYAMRDKVLIGLSDAELKEADQSHAEFLKIFEEKDVNKRAERMTHFQKDKTKIKHLELKFLAGINATLKNKFAGKTFTVKVPIEVIKQPSSKLVSCYAYLGGEAIKCAISCGHWGDLKPSQEESQSRYMTVNLFDHLAEVVPSGSERKIGLVTYQNGINNTFDEFMLMGQSILKNLPRKPPLFFGLYNPTKGVMHDLDRVNNTLWGELSTVICTTYLMLNAFQEKMEALNKEQLWAHFAHSEGGMIAEAALTMIQSGKTREYFKSRLLVATYGAVLPIPKTFAMAVNTYSKMDNATLPRVLTYLKDLGEKESDYEIRVVEASPDNSTLYKFFGLAGTLVKATIDYAMGDHGFQNAAYQKALAKDVSDFSSKAAYYGGKVASS